MPPRDIVPMARLAEELGFGELWFSEDCFFSGGIAGSAAALAATDRLPLGLGIVSAATRHPAVLAMELATLDVQFPGRIYGGIGHGVPAWLDQMGLMPPKPLSALRQCVTAVRRLLDGEELTESEHFHFDKIVLTHAPATRVPLYTGVVNERGLRLSGEIADGTVLSTLSSPAYVRWAREQVDAGARVGGRTRPHRLVTYALFSVDANPAVAKDAVRESIAFYLAAMPDNALSQVYGIRDELADLLAEGGVEHVAKNMPDSWVEDLAVAGAPDECAEKLRRLLDAGSDSIGLWLFPAADAHRIATLTAREVLTRL
ncbi:LLM class flavin-dependent oxidoreductase [Pseudonocardia sp. K10HN5]|uniref:LLM class flavin-dependent oxidoreductase n=2 Tax=Pseudonocardia acidicola TaxID=2724939 RepID=A0ABX1SHA7_9PSEU|nr:LLM class flavin-dependent oxidoreductase [Pseudonocardia acidicola]NMH99942.1 LLM class flavin-dependent oxidoreductase [Pseudonocardia acidicola]